MQLKGVLMKTKVVIACLMALLAASVYAAGNDNNQYQQGNSGKSVVQAQTPQAQPSPARSAPAPAPAPVQAQSHPNPVSAPRAQNGGWRGGWGGYRSGVPGGWGWRGGWGFHVRHPVLFFDFWDYAPVETPYYVPVPYPQTVVPEAVPEEVPSQAAPVPGTQGEENPAIFVSFSGGDMVGGGFVGSIKSHILASGDLALAPTPQGAALEIDVVSRDADSAHLGSASNVTVSYGWLPGRQLVTTQMSLVPSVQIDNMAASVVVYADQLIHQAH
jgi:hypothetical protein